MKFIINDTYTTLTIVAVIVVVVAVVVNMHSPPSGL